MPPGKPSWLAHESGRALPQCPAGFDGRYRETRIERQHLCPIPAEPRSLSREDDGAAGSLGGSRTEPRFHGEHALDGSWRMLTYGDARTLARNIGQALVNRGLSQQQPFAILSGNDLEHALLGLAAMYSAVPYAPISTAYSLVSSDFGKLRHIMDLLTPGLVFASSGKPYERAIRAVVPDNTEIVVTQDPINGATLFSDLVDTAAGASLQDAHRNANADTIIRILFTSGSTGIPKGVINTHRMWCSNQEMIRTHLAFLADEPP